MLHRISLVKNGFGDSTMVISTCVTKKREDAPKKFEDAELQALLGEDSCLSLDRLAKELNVDRSTVGKRLHAMGMVQKEGNWVQNKLKERDMERRLVICEILQ